MLDLSDVLIVSDLDGTFFGNRGARVERNILAIEELSRLGGRFTIATGRFHKSLKVAWPEVVQVVKAPMISCNGACLYDIVKDEVLCERLIDNRRAMAVIEHIKNHYPHLGARINLTDGFMSSAYMCEASERIRREMENCGPTGIIVPEERWCDYDWLKIVVRGEADDLDALEADLKEMMSDIVETTKSGSFFLECQSKGTSKATMLPHLRRYCEEMAGRPLTVYACGDFENDIEMLRAADVAVCPENALDSVKAISDLCLCHHTEGLIADLVEHIIRERA